MDNDEQILTEQETKPSYKGLIVVAVFLIGATLPFHYILERGMVFPKDHLTFSNTFITQRDIDNLIDRYNNASFFEKQAIRQEPLVRKLMEKGLIEEDKSNKKEDGY